jgi:hypothetical protein
MRARFNRVMAVTCRTPASNYRGGDFSGRKRGMWIDVQKAQKSLRGHFDVGGRITFAALLKPL